jgi:hypothetical protein
MFFNVKNKEEKYKSIFIIFAFNITQYINIEKQSDIAQPGSQMLSNKHEQASSTKLSNLKLRGFDPGSQLFSSENALVITLNWICPLLFGQ